MFYPFTKGKLLCFFVILLFVPGCFNMPTPASQITPAYSSGLKYEYYDCRALSIELDSLARRENQLVIAQEQRIKSSKYQAFWIGYGQGDGVEASELANVRGEKEQIRRAMDRLGCDESFQQQRIEQISN
jgi:hypothetical protein